MKLLRWAQEDVAEEEGAPGAEISAEEVVLVVEVGEAAAVGEAEVVGEAQALVAQLDSI